MNKQRILEDRYAYMTTIPVEKFELSQDKNGTITVTGKLSEMPKNWNTVGQIAVSGDAWRDVFNEKQLAEEEVRCATNGWVNVALANGFYPAEGHLYPVS